MTTIDIECAFNNISENNVKKLTPFLEKMLLVGSYYSFGLVGLLTLISNFVSEIETSKTLVIHTVQSLLVGIFVCIFTLCIAVIECFMPIFNFNQELITAINRYWPAFVFVIISLINIGVLIIKRFIFKTTCYILNYLS